MFDPNYFSLVNGNLGAANSKAFPKNAEYITVEDLATVLAPGFFPTSSGLALGDLVRIVQVDNLTRWTTVTYTTTSVTGA